MLTAPIPSNYFFRQLGKLLTEKEPQIAERLQAEFLPQKTPIETDLTKIPFYFTSFCRVQKLDPGAYTGPLYKTSKIDKRRFFIAVVILLYHPRTRLLAKYISETIGQDPGNTNRMIQEVQFRYSHIAEFKVEVDGMVKLLKSVIKQK